MKIKYEATDGKMFDTENECLVYEDALRASLNGCLYDNAFNCLSEERANATEFGSVDIVVISSEGQLNKFRSIINYFGQHLFETDPYEIYPMVFYYDYLEEHWINVETAITNLKEIKKKAMEAYQRNNY